NVTMLTPVRFSVFFIQQRHAKARCEMEGNPTSRAVLAANDSRHIIPICEKRDSFGGPQAAASAALPARMEAIG
ncbi:MAG TPA: hypothetical protein VFU38_10295, partial [Candidatus Krumholzibacteria bacterium]|nr:hypothetical protein [Candidatus Krumholzibacteria bacterium]